MENEISVFKSERLPHGRKLKCMKLHEAETIDGS